VHIDLQRLLNYLLVLLAVSGGIVSGMLAGRIVDLSLGGGEPPLPAPALQAERARQLQEADFQVVLNRNLFNSQAVGSQAEPVDLSLAAAPGQEPPVSKMVGDLELIGTVVAGPDSLALIQVGRKAGVFKLQDEVARGVVLVEIARNKVVVSDQGVRRELLLKQSQAQPEKLTRQPAAAPEAGIVPLDNNRWLISREVVENARSNFNSLLSTARMIPQLENGQTVGFRLLDLKKGSLLAQLGLQLGDLLVEINNVPLDSPEKALQVLQQVREASNISLGLIRNGERQTFEYSFE
jgi:general secretion pathway protein C